MIKSHEGKCNQEMACLEGSQIHTSAAILILLCERNLGRVQKHVGGPSRMIVGDRVPWVPGRPSANTENSRCTREKPLVPRVEIVRFEEECGHFFFQRNLIAVTN